MTVREISPGRRPGTRSLGIGPRAGVERGTPVVLGLGLAVVTATVGVPAVSEQAQSISVAVSADIVWGARGMLRTLTTWGRDVAGSVVHGCALNARRSRTTRRRSRPAGSLRRDEVTPG